MHNTQQPLWSSLSDKPATSKDAKIKVQISVVFGCLPGPNKACLVDVWYVNSLVTWCTESYQNLTPTCLGR